MASWPDGGAGVSAVPVWRVLLGYVRPFRWALAGGAVLVPARPHRGVVVQLARRQLVSRLSLRVCAVDAAEPGT